MLTKKNYNEIAEIINQYRKTKDTAFHDMVSLFSQYLERDNSNFNFTMFQYVLGWMENCATQIAIIKLSHLIKTERNKGIRYRDIMVVSPATIVSPRKGLS